MTATERPRSSHRFQILLCEGPSCGITHESECLKHHLAGKIAADADLHGRVTVIDYMCFGRCSEGPNLFVRRLAPGERADLEPPVTALARLADAVLRRSPRPPLLVGPHGTSTDRGRTMSA